MNQSFRNTLRATTAWRAALFTVLALAACSPDPSAPAGADAEDAALSTAGVPRQGTFYGAAVRVGDGRARTYAVLQNGEPTEIGVALDERALHNLPSIPPGHAEHTHVEYILPFHPHAPAPYRFVELGWNPNGHEPLELYSAPHFDVHFYHISPEERDAIDPADPQWSQKAGKLPGADYVPAGWIDHGTLLGMDPALLTVPRMGLHWVDPRTPELNGQPFTTTFLYGSWDGEFIFIEPMLTKAFLETRPNFSEPVGVAQKYGKPGHYPSSYRVYWEPARREYRVALAGLALRGE